MSTDKLERKYHLSTTECCYNCCYWKGPVAERGVMRGCMLPDTIDEEPTTYLDELCDAYCDDDSE